jgi:hypothetical protein
MQLIHLDQLKRLANARPTRSGPVRQDIAFHEKEHPAGCSFFQRRTIFEKFGAEGGTRTPTPLRVHGPEPCASANSATTARRESPWLDGQSTLTEFLVLQTRRLLSILCGGESSPEETASNFRSRGTPLPMTEQNTADALPPCDGETIPEDLAVEIRRLAHDLSNALEIIVQTSYLLGTVELKEPASDWLRMMDGGVKKALDLNLALRTYIKQHTTN